MTLSTIEATKTKSNQVYDNQGRTCKFGCKNLQKDCFRELLCILYTKDPERRYSRDNLKKILYNKFYFRYQFHGFPSFESYLNEAKERGFININ